jgi:hypothetical protein
VAACRAAASREGWHTALLRTIQKPLNTLRCDLADLTRLKWRCISHALKVADIPQLRSLPVADKLHRHVLKL